MKRFDFDVAVIGGGSGGYAAARTAASAGLKTVVIEGGKEVGGLCILRGCMPTKAMLYAAEVKHLAEHAETWGVRAGKVSFDFAKVMARKNAQIKDFADFRVQQLNAGKFKFIRANARFLDAHTVELMPSPGLSPRKRVSRQAQRENLTAKHFVIATGSSVAPSPLPQLDEVGFITSDDAVALKKLPKSLIILGGGAIACEFAQFFARFGVKVTLIQRSEHILKEFDADAGIEIEKVFRREGIQVFTGTKLAGREAQRKIENRFVRAERENAFPFPPRKFCSRWAACRTRRRLNLENAGVKTEQWPHHHERQNADERAAHFCGGRLHRAARDRPHRRDSRAKSRRTTSCKPKSPRRMDYRLLISVVFTEPQVASVGLTEKEAKARGIKFLAASYPFNDHGKSLIMEAKDGFVKLLANPKTGEILGGACVGPVGGELIHEIVAAMAKRMTVHELAAMPHYHPTLAEIWTYPAEELAEQI